MLNKRYKFDGKPILQLNEIQLESKKVVEDRIKSKEYTFEKVNCVVCNNSDFELLAEKDRYGLHVSTVICKECGLLQTNPRMNQESYNKFYDTNYRKLYKGSEIATEEFFNFQKIHGKAILDCIEQRTNERFRNKFVVEIGTGAGGILQTFKDNNNKVFGLDLGSEYINFGKKKGLDLNVGTIKKLKELKIKPDLIIYSHVLEHILNPYEELKELRKYLKKDSLVYIEVPGVKDLKLNKSYNQDLLMYLQNAHVYHFSLETLKNITAKAGFSMLYGNERIGSIFRIGNINKNYKNDYKETMLFLRNLEEKRRNPFNLFRIKNKVLYSLVSLSKKTGTFEIARKLFKIINNTKQHLYYTKLVS